MNAVSAVLLFILVCFTAVCQAEDEDISVICDEVTGSVGKEVNLTCSVSLQNTNCCIIMYKFQYPKIYNDSEICKEVLPQSEYPCAPRNSFTCSYTPTTAITQPFRFIVQTPCGRKTTEFTLNTPAKTSAAGAGSEVSVIAAVLSCFILVISIMTIIRNKNANFSRSCGFQKKMFLCIRPDEDSSTRPEAVI